MRRFYASPERSHQVERAALVGMLATAAALLFTAFVADRADTWISLILPAGVFAVAAVTFIRARLAERQPVAEVTDTHLRWREPGKFFYRSVRLDDLVSADWTDGKLLLMDRRALARHVPLKDLHFREGSFAVNALRAEIEDAIASNEKALASAAN